MTSTLARSVHEALSSKLASTARNALRRSQHVSTSRRGISTTSAARAQYRRFGDDFAARAGRSYGNNISSRVRNLPPIVYVVGGGGGVYYVYHLERTETGRLRFMDTSEISERQMGDAATQEILQQYAGRILPDSHPTSKYVKKVADRILSASGLDTRTHGQGAMKEISDAWKSSEKKEGVNWKVRVIADDQTKNAFVLPNGSIFVFTGILPICGNEDGLAAVLGHEVAHQVARHAGERMSSQKINLALSFLASFLGVDPNLTGPAVGLLLTLPNSRAAETEADHIGLKLASRACYDPAEAANLWVRMQKSEGGGGTGNVGFLSTHPTNSRRIEQIKEWLPEAYQVRSESCGTMAEQRQLFNQASFWR